MKDGLKILRAEIKDFKNISLMTVDFEGRSAFIIGPNNVGKSSFLQAVMSPVDASFIPAEPIKRGEEKGSIELTIGGVIDDELVKYEIGLYFSAQHKKGRLNILSGDGAKLGSKKSIIEGIVGAIGFDVMDFLSMGQTKTGKMSAEGVREQIELLKSLMPFDVRETFKDLDVEYKKVYSERHEKNLEIKNINGQIADFTLTDEEIDTYGVKKDAEPVEEKISKLSDEIEKWNKADNYYNATTDRIEAYKRQLEELKEAISINEDGLKKTEAWFKKNPEKPSIENLTTELKDINEHNGVYEEIIKLEGKQKSIKELQDESETRTNRLAAILDERKELFANNPLPVKELTFDEEQILYKGLPFNDDTQSSAVLIGVGIRLGMALNPNLRLLTIKDGSLLDKRTLKFILKLCNDEGYQILIEKVAEDGRELEVQFTES